MNQYTKLLEYFEKNQDRVITIRELTEKFNGVKKMSLQNSVTYILTHKKLPGLEVISSGNAWRYNNPNGGGTPANVRANLRLRTFTELGTSKKGDTIIEDDDGNLFYAWPLENSDD